MNSTRWNPELYLKFRNERTQPSIDLVNRIALEAPGVILDIGCGPGNSTQVLCQKWPAARVTGLDNSPQMIEKARKDHPNQNWILSSAETFVPPQEYDLVFSNATIQWIPNHEQLIPKLLAMVKRGGALAVQVPAFSSMPAGKLLERIEQMDRWDGQLSGTSAVFSRHPLEFYYNILSPLCSRMELWQTDYFHIMESAEAILDWVRGTALRPYLERLGSVELRTGFEADVLAGIKKNYPSQQDGKVLFPFRRLFFVAYSD